MALALGTGDPASRPNAEAACAAAEAAAADILEVEPAGTPAPPRVPAPAPLPFNAELADGCCLEVTVTLGADVVVVAGWESELGIPSHMVSLDFDRRCRSFPLARLTVSSLREEEVYCTNVSAADERNKKRRQRRWGVLHKFSRELLLHFELFFSHYCTTNILRDQDFG